MFGVFGVIGVVTRTQATTIEGYDTLNVVKVISNDGQVAYTEDGEEWALIGRGMLKMKQKK